MPRSSQLFGPLASFFARGDMKTASNALPPKNKANVKYSKMQLANAMLPVPRCQYADA
jgi:hypothetical protein